jgi:2-desacetyl-2-hydroxyethyl bacteriochlorophyllide A dehydrogenase
MKAAVLEAVGQLVVRDVDVPTIGPKDVLVKSRACGVCGTDVHIWEGDFFPSFPLIPGHELAGEVVEVGRDVKDLVKGDRVMVDPTVTCDDCHFCQINRQNHCLNWNALGVTKDGGFAEYVRVPARNCYKFDRVSFAEAAFTEPVACVVFGHDRLKMEIGSDVLIFGAGPIGQLHVQASKANGAATITVVDKVPAKLEEARRHGAHHGVVAGDRMGDELRKIAKYGFDAVIDCTGVGAVTKLAIPFVKNGGKLLIFGVCGPQEMVEISPFEIYRRDLEIIGSFAIRRSYDRAHRLMEAGVFDVKSLVSEVMPLEDLTRALHLMKAGSAGMKLQIQLGS